MSKRFQLVGSLLRPKELLEYKRKIEERDDISYPFYADFEGYESCEDAAIRQVIKHKLTMELLLSPMESFQNRCGTWIFIGDLQG